MAVESSRSQGVPVNGHKGDNDLRLCCTTFSTLDRQRDNNDNDDHGHGHVIFLDDRVIDSNNYRDPNELINIPVYNTGEQKTKQKPEQESTQESTQEPTKESGLDEKGQ